MTVTTCRIVKYPHQHRVYVPYEAKDLVKAVPGSKWNPDPLMRCWTIPTTQLITCMRFLTSEGFEVRVIDSTVPLRDENWQAEQQPDQVFTGWATLLLQALGCRFYLAGHKALTQVLHPDAGGDTALMQDLNAARDAAKRKCGC